MVASALLHKCSTVCCLWRRGSAAGYSGFLPFALLTAAASSRALALLTRPPLASRIAAVRSSRRLVVAEAIVTTQQPSSASSIAQGSPAASVVHFLVALWLASCRFLMAPFPASPVAVFCGFCFAGFMASMFSGRFAGRARIRGRSAPVAVTPLACGIRDRRTARRRRMRARPPGCRGSRPARRRWPVRC